MNRRLLRLVREDRTNDVNTLIARSGRGDQEAFALLYDELSPSVYGVILRVIRNQEIAEEVTQEVFVELWRIASRFDPLRGTVRSWASTVAHRRAVDRVRSEQSRIDREQRDHERRVEPPTDMVGEHLELVADREDVHDALLDLTDMQREAVSMAYFGGHTYQQVAAILEVPEGTVKTRIRDGLIKLRDSIETPL